MGGGHLCKNHKQPTKGTVFFYFPGIVYFFGFFGKNRVSEWKTRFFFRGPEKKTAFSNEWVSEIKLFQGKIKKQKNERKKKNKPKWFFFLKKIERLKKNEFFAHKLFLEKKHLFFYFFYFFGKNKNTFFKFEWVSDP